VLYIVDQSIDRGSASERLRGNRRFLSVQRYVSGSVFCGLGVLTAVAKRH